ncbi:MAG: hypothetical protein GC159_17855 [Phycisphaera sp.]|nr:hypothetical protein [Phycisphaera sp.]
MKTGFDEVARRYRWRGRRWLVGLLRGLWIGLVLGVVIGSSINFPRLFGKDLGGMPAFFTIMAAMILLDGILRYIETLLIGKPPLKDDKPDDD